MKETKKFGEWILDIGDGKIGTDENGKAEFEIPEDLLILNSDDGLSDLVNFSYPDLLLNMSNFNYFEERAILAPTLESVEKVNEYILSFIPRDKIEHVLLMKKDALYQIGSLLSS